ncbi:MAG: two-component regulator propeller domain-containing protein [Rhodanobacteraceae bacterium]
MVFRGYRERYLDPVVLAAAVASMFFATHARAAEQQLSQFGHSVWRTQDGLFATPNGITQSNDGYLWIATDRGLTRFDGVRFVSSNEMTGFPGTEFRLSAVLGTRDGDLWVGMGSRAAHIRHGVSAKQYLVPHLPTQILEDVDGSVWMVETRGAAGEPICHFTDQNTQCYGPPTLPMKYGATFIGNSEEGFWIGSSSGLCHWYPGKGPADCFLQQTQEAFAGLEGVSSILRTRDGSLMVGVGRSGPGLGLGTLVDGAWRSFLAQDLDGSKLSVSALIQDRDGAIWIGTYDDGIYRVSQGRAEHYGSKDGLSSDDVARGGIFEDREGIVWVLTSAGIDAFRHQRVSVFSIRQGLRSDMVESLLARRNGEVWLGNKWLSVLRNDRNTPPDHPEVFGDRPVTSLFEDAAGIIWIGLDKTLQIYTDGILREVRGTDGKSLGIVTNLLQDTAGDIWASTADNHRLVRIHKDVVVEELDPKPFDDPRVSLAADPAGGIWIAARRGLLASYRDGKLAFLSPDLVRQADIRHIFVDSESTLFAATTAGLLIRGAAGTGFVTTAKGIPCDNLGAVVKDLQGDVWLNGTCGLVRIDAAEVRRWLSAQDTPIHSLVLDSTDGAQTGFGSFSPRAGVAPDGRVWFATGRFTEVVDPEADVDTPVAAAKIEELTADRKTYSTSGRVALPASSRDISIRYTAFSFGSPQKTQFRYKLEGRDSTWEDVGTRREAFYTDLPPGNYVFRVKASDLNGTFGAEDASVSFDVPPLFYQTRWFLALCAIGVALIAYGVFLIRLRQVAERLRQQMRVKSLERERIARDLHDTLLQDTQALVLQFQTVAEDMPAGHPTRQLMERALDHADEILAEGRDTVLELRDPEAKSLNLHDALSQVGDDLSRTETCAYRAIVEGQARRLAASVREEAYRIGREALINAFQHSHANNIELQVSYGAEALVVQVRDDGKGIDPTTIQMGKKPGHWGLTGMRERARELGGRIDIWSGSKPGTEIQLVVPAEIAYWRSDASSQTWLNRLGFTGRRNRNGFLESEDDSDA